MSSNNGLLNQGRQSDNCVPKKTQIKFRVRPKGDVNVHMPNIWGVNRSSPPTHHGVWRHGWRRAMLDFVMAEWRPLAYISILALVMIVVGLTHGTVFASNLTERPEKSSGPAMEVEKTVYGKAVTLKLPGSLENFTSSCQLPLTDLSNLQVLKISNVTFNPDTLVQALQGAKSLTSLEFTNIEFTKIPRSKVALPKLNSFVLKLRTLPCRITQITFSRLVFVDVQNEQRVNTLIIFKDSKLLEINWTEKRIVSQLPFSDQILKELYKAASWEELTLAYATVNSNYFPKTLRSLNLHKAPVNLPHVMKRCTKIQDLVLTGIRVHLDLFPKTLNTLVLKSTFLYLDKGVLKNDTPIALNSLVLNEIKVSESFIRDFKTVFEPKEISIKMGAEAEDTRINHLFIKELTSMPGLSTIFVDHLSRDETSGAIDFNITENFLGQSGLPRTSNAFTLVNAEKTWIGLPIFPYQINPYWFHHLKVENFWSPELIMSCLDMPIRTKEEIDVYMAKWDQLLTPGHLIKC